MKNMKKKRKKENHSKNMLQWIVKMNNLRKKLIMKLNSFDILYINYLIFFMN